MCVFVRWVSCVSSFKFCICVHLSEVPLIINTLIIDYVFHPQPFPCIINEMWISAPHKQWAKIKREVCLQTSPVDCLLAHHCLLSCYLSPNLLVRAVWTLLGLIQSCLNLQSACGGGRKTTWSNLKVLWLFWLWDSRCALKYVTTLSSYLWGV